MSNAISEVFYENKLDAEIETAGLMETCEECGLIFQRGYDTGLEQICPACDAEQQDAINAWANRTE